MDCVGAVEKEASPRKNLHKILFHSQRHHPNDDDDDDGDDRCMRKIQDRGEQDRVWSRAWWQIVKITFLGGDGDFKGTMRKIE